MSSDMDSDDKTFFSQMFSNVEKRIDRIEVQMDTYRKEVKEHLNKTCTELDEVKEIVIRIDENKQTDEKKETKKFLKNINTPQWIMAGIVTTGTIITLIVTFGGF